MENGLKGNNIKNTKVNPKESVHIWLKHRQQSLPYSARTQSHYL